MSRLLTLSWLFLQINTVLFSQELYYKTYNWEESVYDIPENSNKEKVVLMKEEVIEFSFQDDMFYEYYLVHQVEFINSDEEVERSNKKYIPYESSSEVVEAKARVIKAGKELIELDKEKILTSYDERTDENYKYFALEGLEKGNLVDLYYVIKKAPGYNGAYKIIQGAYPLLDYRFKLLAPVNLIFDFKLLNDTNLVNKDTTFIKKNGWTLHLKNVPPLQNEDNAPYELLLKKIMYRLDKNLASAGNEISSYNRASQNIYSNIYEVLNKDDKRALKKFNRQIDLQRDMDLDERIYNIEQYIKENINIVDYDNGGYGNMADVIYHKNASKYGITALFANIFKLNAIDHQIVLTCDRNKAKFDPDFESFHFLSRYLIYFPETRKFLAPDQFPYRYDLIPQELTDNHGLFIKEIIANDYKTGVGLVRYIPPADYKDSYYNHDVRAVINKDFTQVDMDVVMKSTGYYSVYLQPYLDLFSEDIVERVIDETFHNYIPHLIIDDWQFKNSEADAIGREPLVIEAKGSSKEMIDIAGDRFLFKLGDLIGPQVEMYSQEKRDLPVYDSYKRAFHRNLIIDIPHGYSIRNKKDIEIYADYIKDDKKVLLFKSTYEMKGNTLTVSIEEYYDQLYYEMDEYPQYREVVNSASDFNKVVLVLEKVD